jgi:MoaA/NifB/PqqE/SkfB family radical SAM enzyme
MRGDETAHCTQHAPRVVQMSMTNACNKTCGFCYRPLEAKSRWTYDTIVDFARYLDRWGVLELALGGGEPTVFPRFPQLVRQLWRDTSLAINFTTNGTRLTDDLLGELAGFVGQIQVSVYDDEALDGTIERLVAHGMRFGLNYLVTPHRLRTLDLDILRWADMGVADVLLLSYKGREALHLNDAELASLDSRILRLHEHLRGRLQLKVDVCWSTRLAHAPQLFFDEDCRAGSLFMSVTSEREVLSCSFGSGAIPFERFEELPDIYQMLKHARRAAPSPGCARLPKFGSELVTLSPRKPRYSEAR